MTVYVLVVSGVVSGTFSTRDKAVREAIFEIIPVLEICEEGEESKKQFLEAIKNKNFEKALEDWGLQTETGWSCEIQETRLDESAWECDLALSDLTLENLGLTC